MKRFFKAFGIGILYFLLFFGSQIVMSFVFTLVISVIYISNNTVLIYDASLLETELMQIVFENIHVISIFSNIAALAIVGLIFYGRRKNTLKEIRLVPCKPMFSAVCVIMAMGAVLVFNQLFEFIPFPDSLTNEYAQEASLIQLGDPILIWISTVIAAPIAEEVFFRGLIYTRFKNGMPKYLAAVLAAMIFGFAHGQLIWALATFVIGLIIIWVYEQTNSIIPCIALHFLNNAYAQTFTFLQVPQSAEIYLSIVGVLLIAIALPYFIIYKKRTAAE